MQWRGPVDERRRTIKHAQRATLSWGRERSFETQPTGGCTSGTPRGRATTRFSEGFPLGSFEAIFRI